MKRPPTKTKAITLNIWVTVNLAYFYLKKLVDEGDDSIQSRYSSGY